MWFPMVESLGAWGWKLNFIELKSISGQALSLVKFLKSLKQSHDTWNLITHPLTLQSLCLSQFLSVVTPKVNIILIDYFVIYLNSLRCVIEFKFVF